MNDTIRKTGQSEALPAEDNFEMDFSTEKPIPTSTLTPSALEIQEMVFDDISEDLDDIEAELLALREAVESMDELVAEAQASFEDDEADEESEYIETESVEQTDDAPALLSEADDDEASVSLDNTPAEVEELDSYSALAAELFEQADSEDYGINSQRFNPDEFDVASQTEEISPVHIDEDELEVIDAADLEAMLNNLTAHDEQVDTPDVGETTEVEFTLDDEPYIPVDSEQFRLDDDVMDNMIEITDEPAVSQSSGEVTEASIVIDVDVADDVMEMDEVAHQTQPETVRESMETNIGVDIDVADDVIEVDEVAHQMQPETARESMETNIGVDIDVADDVIEVDGVAHQTPPETTREQTDTVIGLDLDTTTDDTLTLLNKIKQEMASKFDIDLHLPSEQTVESKIESEPETQTETVLTSESLIITDNSHLPHRLVAATAPIDEISLDDIFVQEQPPKLTLTAEPLNEADLEVFDESTLSALPVSSVLRDEEPLTEVELDLSVDMLPNLAEPPARTSAWETEVEALPAQALEEEVFEQEIDFSDILSELPPETLEEVSLTDMEELKRIANEITEMEELPLDDEWVAPKEPQPLTDDILTEQLEEAFLTHFSEHRTEVQAVEPESKTAETDIQAAITTEQSFTDNIRDAIHNVESKAQDAIHAVKERVEQVMQPENESVATEQSFTDNIRNAIHNVESKAQDAIHAVKERVEQVMQPENESVATEQSFTDNIRDAIHNVESKAQDALDSVKPQVATPETVLAETETLMNQDDELIATQLFTADANHAAVEPKPTPVSAETMEADKRGWASRLKQGLTKSRNQMAKSLASVFGGGKIDEDLYEELETTLLISDMGIEATEQLMKEVRNRVSLKGLKDGAQLRAALKEAICDLLKPLEQPLVLPESKQPFVIMMAGINGAGKTTSIGKLAKYFQSQGKSVMLAAGDTFRAAAREQLQEWGARNGVTVISQASGDSAAVCFDAVESAKAKGIDIVLADTAGRLPTQLHLMEEIKKVKRVLQKSMPDAPHEIMVVLDANIGQNAINQVVAFDDALGVTGLIVTKLDGTAKGGVLAALASSRPIPVRYIGVGEGIDDLRPFDARAFVDALLDD